MCHVRTTSFISLNGILIQMLMAVMNPLMNVHVLFPSFEMRISYALICFYFTDYKLLCQRLVVQGNVLEIDAKRNQ